MFSGSIAEESLYLWQTRTLGYFSKQFLSGSEFFSSLGLSLHKILSVYELNSSYYCSEEHSEVRTFYFILKLKGSVVCQIRRVNQGVASDPAGYLLTDHT